MPGRRSYVACIGELSHAQKRRKERDEYFCRFKRHGGFAFSEKHTNERSYSCRAAGQDDPLQIPENDPWCAARFPMANTSKSNVIEDNYVDVWRNFLPIVPPPCDLRIDAASFSPASEHANSMPSHASALIAGSWYSPGYICALESLVACQNNTITMMCGQLESLQKLTISSGDQSASSSVSLSCLSKNVMDLAASLPAAVEESVSKKLPMIIKPFLADAIQAVPSTHSEGVTDACVLEKKFAALVRPHVADVLQIVDDAINSRLANAVAQMTKRVTELIKEHDILLQKQMTRLSKNIDRHSIVMPTPSVDEDLMAPLASASDLNIPPSSVFVATVDKSKGSVCGSPSKLSKQCSAPSGSARREMTTHEFLEVVSDIRARLPHLMERPGPLLMICDASQDQLDVLSDATSELASEDGFNIYDASNSKDLNVNSLPRQAS